MDRRLDVKIRRLTQDGMNQFDEFLASLATDSPYPIPHGLLSDEEASSAFEHDIEAELKTFPSRFDCAKYFNEILGDLQRDISRDAGLWSWLSLYYFEQICPKKNGKFVPGERARWIPATTEHFRYYRHLLAGPYRIYNANQDNPERAMIFLYGPVGTVGHFYYQLVSRQEYITNKAIVQLATDLYLDADTQRQKRGAQTRGKPGTVFRLTSFLNQLDTTWDLYSMSPLELRDRLPKEFGRFLDSATS
jgi:hypothetical protein